MSENEIRRSKVKTRLRKKEITKQKQKQNKHRIKKQTQQIKKQILTFCSINSRTLDHTH